MRRRALIPAVLAGLMPATLLAGSSAAGPPALDGNGRFLIVEGSLSPPVAGTRARPRGVAVEFASFAGNVRDGRPPSGTSRTRTTDIRTPRGMRYNHALFPACRLAVLDRQGPPACPRGSRIGSGTVIVDARPLLSDFLRVSQVLVFNGKDGNGRPAIITWTKVSGLTLTTFQTVRPPRAGFGPSFYGANPDTESRFSTTSVALHFPRRSTTVRGRRRYLWEAPETCRGSWRFQQVNTTFAGARMVASHSIPCVAAG